MGRLAGKAAKTKPANPKESPTAAPIRTLVQRRSSSGVLDGRLVTIAHPEIALNFLPRTIAALQGCGKCFVSMNSPTGKRVSAGAKCLKHRWKPPGCRGVASEIQGIIGSAGEPGDRWFSYRKMAGREESPDTIVVGSQEPVTKRATRLITSGGEPRRFCRKAGLHASACGAGLNPARCGALRKVPQRIRPPAECSPVTSSRETCKASSEGAFGSVRVKRWGKSPPSR